MGTVAHLAFTIAISITALLLFRQSVGFELIEKYCVALESLLRMVKEDPFQIIRETIKLKKKHGNTVDIG